MKYRAAFVAGASVGYLLGTRAGRERYEQIKRACRHIAENPTVQETAGLLRAQMGAVASTAKERAAAKLDQVLGPRLPRTRQAEEQRAAHAHSVESSAPQH